MATKSTFTTELDAIRANAITLDSDDAILAEDWAAIDTEYKAKLATMHTIKHRWQAIHTDVADYVPDGSSILDLGCGDKEILNTITCDDYHGVDLNSAADEIHDLDGSLLTWDRTWDVGLCIETLPFINDPARMLNHYKQFATNWVISLRPIIEDNLAFRTSKVNFKHGWTRDQLIVFLNEIFTSVTVSDIIYTEIETYGTGFPKPFLIAVCS